MHKHFWGLQKNKNEVKAMLDKLALSLLIIGGVNWGLVGIFQVDVIAWLFGGPAAIISRVIYILVALSAIWCISLFFKEHEVFDRDLEHHRV